VYDGGLADALAAEMASSRWRVCWALYAQFVSFTTALLVLIIVPGKYNGLIAWVLAVVAASVWWWGVIRDHHKDDLKYLAGHIHMVRNMVQNLDQLESKMSAFPAEEQAAIAANLAGVRSKFQEILGNLKARESRHCQNSFVRGLAMST
jgi:hypothetical protein